MEIKTNIENIVSLLQLANTRFHFLPTPVAITHKEYYLLAKLVVYFVNQKFGVKSINDVNEVSLYNNNVVEIFCKESIRKAIDTYKDKKPEWAQHWQHILSDNATSNTRYHELNSMYLLSYRCACVIQLAPNHVEMKNIVSLLALLSENYDNQTEIDFSVYLTGLLFAYSAL